VFWRIAAANVPRAVVAAAAAAAAALLLLLAVGYLWSFLVVVTCGIDAVFDASDPLPFLGLHFVQVGQCLKVCCQPSVGHATTLNRRTSEAFVV
jgi:hypothetical protein